MNEPPKKDWKMKTPPPRLEIGGCPKPFGFGKSHFEYYYATYDSVSHYYDVGVAGAKSSDSLCFDYSNHDFLGRTFYSWENVRESVHTYWKEGDDLLNDMVCKLQDSTIELPKVARRSRRWSEDNGDVNVDRILNGDDAYRSELYKKHTTGSRTITLLVQNGGNAGVKPLDFQWRASAAIALTEMLQDAGYSVEITAFTATRNCFEKKYGKPDSLVEIIPVKLADDLMDNTMVMNAMSAASFRTVHFGTTFYTGDMEGLTPTGGLGYTIESNKIVYPEILRDVSFRPVLIPATYNERNTINVVNDIITQLNEGKL